MPWYNGNFPPSYKNQPLLLRNKAVEIANDLLLRGTDEGIAIATGLKRARLFFAKSTTTEKPKSTPMTDKKLQEAFHDYDDFMMKKRQYAKAVHMFHDQTTEYNEVIDDLPVAEMESRQKEFLQHERDFHDVMDSFERALHRYQKTLVQWKGLKKPVQITVGKTRYSMSMVKGQMEVRKI